MVAASPPQPDSDNNDVRSPFIVGRPLRFNEPIFGREEALRFIGSEIGRFSSVNIVGERRMGKTSLLNHLLAHQDKYLQADGQSLHRLAYIDLQDRVSNANRFYGTGLRELLAQLPQGKKGPLLALTRLGERLKRTPEAQADEFREILETLRELKPLAVRPILVVDELELLLDPLVRDGFPYPAFFNGLRALITAGLLAMIVASRRPLIDYFTDPSLPNNLTSTFPNYFQPYTLPLLDDADADALLLQKSIYPLSNLDVLEARRWSKGHPCRLQVAGAAVFQRIAGNHSQKWCFQRRAELSAQNCLTPSQSVLGEPKAWRRYGVNFGQMVTAGTKFVVWRIPLSTGRLVQLLGKKFDDISAWLIGMTILITVILLLAGLASRADIVKVVKRSVGVPTEDRPNP